MDLPELRGELLHTLERIFRQQKDARAWKRTQRFMKQSPLGNDPDYTAIGLLAIEWAAQRLDEDPEFERAIAPRLHACAPY